MPITSGFHHVATLSTDLDRTIAFYRRAFDTSVLAELDASGDHPRMAVISVGAGAALHAFEVPPDHIVGERRRQGARGAIDHFALAAGSLATLELLAVRLAEAGAQEVGAIQRLGPGWSLFFRDVDGMELEVCAPPDR